jgi:site-specific recombinase XerD
MDDSSFADKIINLFLSHLDESGVSSNTIKFYKSDIAHFTAWLILRIRSLGSEAENLTESIPFLSKNIAGEYKKYLLDNKVAKLTANRRLSSLRNLSRFLVGTQIIDSDFMEGMSNITGDSYESDPLLNEFERYLKQEKVSNNTIKSYLSDIRQFISWIEKTSI